MHPLKDAFPGIAFTVEPVLTTRIDGEEVRLLVHIERVDDAEPGTIASPPPTSAPQDGQASTRTVIRPITATVSAVDDRGEAAEAGPSLMGKLGARNRVEIAMWAYETDRIRN